MNSRDSAMILPVMRKVSMIVGGSVFRRVLNNNLKKFSAFRAQNICHGLLSVPHFKKILVQGALSVLHLCTFGGRVPPCLQVWVLNA